MNTQLHLNKIGNLIVQTTQSITRLIEVLFEVDLKVHIITQERMKHCPKRIENFYSEDEGTPILREICLIDEYKKPYIFAESIYYLDHIQAHIRDELLYSNTPIGKIIERYKLEFYREILDIGIIQDAKIANYLSIDETEPMIYKVCNTWHQSKKLFTICEYFPIKQLHLAQKHTPTPSNNG